MAYVKQNWECGEMITADKLNHMEDGIAAGGDCDCGFECTETRTTLTNESVTTTMQQSGMNVGALSYSQLIEADLLIVTFNGTEYRCERVLAQGMGYMYGGYNPTTQMPDFSEYPFVIVSNGNSNGVVTQSAGTYTVKIETAETAVSTTPCFRKAVESAVEKPVTPLIVKPESLAFGTGSVTLVTDTTWQQVHDAIENGIPCYIGFRLGVNLCTITSLDEVPKAMIPIHLAQQGGGIYAVEYSNGIAMSTSSANSVLEVISICGDQ